MKTGSECRYNGVEVQILPGSPYPLGARWDVRESVALKLEASHVESDTGSNGGLTNLQPGFRPGGSYNLVSASVDFVF